MAQPSSMRGAGRAAPMFEDGGPLPAPQNPSGGGRAWRRRLLRHFSERWPAAGSRHMAVRAELGRPLRREEAARNCWHTRPAAPPRPPRQLGGAPIPKVGCVWGTRTPSWGSTRVAGSKRGHPHVLTLGDAERVQGVGCGGTGGVLGRGESRGTPMGTNRAGMGRLGVGTLGV